MRKDKLPLIAFIGSFNRYHFTRVRLTLVGVMVGYWVRAGNAVRVRHGARLCLKSKLEIGLGQVRATVRP